MGVVTLGCGSNGRGLNWLRFGGKFWGLEEKGAWPGPGAGPAGVGGGATHQKAAPIRQEGVGGGGGGAESSAVGGRNLKGILKEKFGIFWEDLGLILCPGRHFPFPFPAPLSRF